MLKLHFPKVNLRIFFLLVVKIFFVFVLISFSYGILMENERREMKKNVSGKPFKENRGVKFMAIAE